MAPADMTVGGFAPGDVVVLVGLPGRKGVVRDVYPDSLLVVFDGEEQGAPHCRHFIAPEHVQHTEPRESRELAAWMLEPPLAAELGAARKGLVLVAAMRAAKDNEAADIVESLAKTVINMVHRCGTCRGR